MIGATSDMARGDRRAWRHARIAVHRRDALTCQPPCFRHRCTRCWFCMEARRGRHRCVRRGVAQCVKVAQPHTDAACLFRSGLCGTNRPYDRTARVQATCHGDGRLRNCRAARRGAYGLRRSTNTRELVPCRTDASECANATRSRWSFLWRQRRAMGSALTT